MAGATSGIFTQCDWLISGPDFPVLPTGNTKFLLPCDEKWVKNTTNCFKNVVITVEADKISTKNWKQKHLALDKALTDEVLLV